MKLLIFTPACNTSAIGRMVRIIVNVLKEQGHTIGIVRSEDLSLLDSSMHDYGCEVMRWDELEKVDAATRAADMIVYQIGDNYHYHRGCLEWMPLVPGIVCLHDFFLGNLFWAWADGRCKIAEEILKSLYGPNIAAAYFRFGSPTEFVESTRQTAPMTEWIAAQATGVITHSGWDAQRVLESCPGPVEVVPLPYRGSHDAIGGQTHPTPRFAEFQVLTFGHINPNKRAESVIRALGISQSLRHKSSYHLVGVIAPDVSARLRGLAASLKVPLRISGEVNEATLMQAIDEADVVCCLRLPALEAASASTIEAMLYAKPVVVMDVGFYQSLPDDCVKKINPKSEVLELQRTLEVLYESPQERRAMGRRAAQWAAATFDPVSYADRLVAMGQETARLNPALQATRGFTSTLARWGAPDHFPLDDTLDPLKIFELRI
ncbi:MAG: glycosyltransferase [Alphaproteobacteria bacterium]|nr:MAG: glycosyltransferase [Alphaproteobacteria bacterium]